LKHTLTKLVTMPLSVAIVGSGIGAASTCYFLNKLFEGNIKIDVYESESSVGGRSMPMKVDGRNMEVGAGIAYSGNKYISDWAKQFNLERTKPSGNKFGLWNGSNFVFEECKMDNLTPVKIVTRYGRDLYTLRSTVYSTLEKFNKIYKVQDDGTSFESAADLWKHLGLFEYTQKSFKDEMCSRLSSNSKLLSELMFAVNKVNYNQSNNINALAGLVSMCPIITGDVFSLETGWTAIHKEIFKNATVHLSSPVTRVRSVSAIEQSTDGHVERGVTRLPDIGCRYEVESGGNVVGHYDAVVVCAPSSSLFPIKFELDGEPVDTSTFNKEYQVTHTTFVKGKMNESYFTTKKEKGMDQSSWGSAVVTWVMRSAFGSLYDDSNTLPTQIYLVEGAEKKEKFSSYSKYFDYKNDPYGHGLYKIFSTDPLQVSTLNELFSPDSSVVATKKWWAYPKFCPPEDISASFRVKKGHAVFNSSILEWSVSALEVAAISGRNAALLVHKDLMKNSVCYRTSETTSVE